jgi:hypothetical protein
MSNRSPDSILFSIYPEAVVGTTQLFYAPIAEGIVGVLTEDREDGVYSMTMKALTDYGLDQQEACELALNNVWKRNLEPSCLPITDNAEDLRLQIIHDDEPLAATYVYRLAAYCKSPYGAFFILPTRRHLIFHEVIDRKFIPAVHELIFIARTLVNNPAPINAELYWRSVDGLIKRVSYDLVDDKLTIHIAENLLPFFAEIP